MLNHISNTSGRCWVIRFTAFVILASLLLYPRLTASAAAGGEGHAERQWLEWEALPDLPDGIGVAGPYVGVSNDALIVAGGANFPTEDGQNIWDVPKVWHDTIWVLHKNDQNELVWAGPFHLNKPLAYGGAVSTEFGILCIGGNDADATYADCFLLRWDSENKSIEQVTLPPLPQPSAFMAAAMIGQTVYVAGGQSGSGLETAHGGFWRMDLSGYKDHPDTVKWETLPTWPGPARAFNIVVSQHNGFNDCIYIISGRRVSDEAGGIEFLRDVYEFNPSVYDASAYDASTGKYAGEGEFAAPWRRRADAPGCVMAGTAAAVGQSHIFVLSGADGSLFFKADELRDDHPGFPKKSYAYHTITDTWVDAGETPSNQVTTNAVKWGGSIIVAAGEVRPRVRTTAVWKIDPVESERSFGVANFSVLVIYLLSMVGVGVYFMNKNKNTDDYFRGGKQIVWWAAACSIFATMLSSLTFMGIPSKAYAQDWVYFLGNMMIPVVAPIAVFIALPFFRRIDATSAYEYLEKRFNRGVRMFASLLFILFHVFRMAIVMSLSALALASVTPMSPVTCVLIMGVLSIIYCTMGGVEAVVWTDTIQTFILLGGALFCLVLAVMGTDGGFSGVLDTASTHNKLHMVNFHLDPTSASLALWIVILGGIGQNISSYTADQAVVQRYMTTSSSKQAANSIWLAAFLAVPASLLFYGLGTVLFAYYAHNPGKLDPTHTTDQILPLFIVQEVPVGIAGLIVAGIFAAAQSTISTSMNSTATAATVDFFRPMNLFKTDNGYLNAARVTTLLLGTAGTCLAIVFVDPSIKSLFDKFIMVIGLFMGVLGGLFALGALTVRSHALGAMIGVIIGAAVMFALPLFTSIQGFIYAAIGISTCFVIGYLVSYVVPGKQKDLSGLTVHTVQQDAAS